MIEKFGRYEILEQLGKGGMATVYKAYDPQFEREVALKTLPNQFWDDPESLGRFEREAKTIANLEHPAIVPVYDYGETDGQPYLVMRHMAGGSLANLLKSGPVSLKQALEIITHIADALDKAHQSAIVHRDLKPANILLDENGKAYLSDFGIAKALKANATFTGSKMMIGTPAYMSPEQVRSQKDIDGRTDIYALGALLYHMLVGAPPYQADDAWAVIMKHIESPAPRLLDARPDLPPGCESVITKAMAKKRRERFATAGDFAGALRLAIMSGENLELSGLWQQSQPASTGITELTGVITESTQRLKRQFYRLPWWARGGIVSLALAGLFFSLYQALAKSPDQVTLSPVTASDNAQTVTQSDPSVVSATDISGEMAVPDVIKILEWGPNAIWQVDEKPNLIPDDGSLPITTTKKSHTLHSNADLMTLLLPGKVLLYLDVHSSIMLTQIAGVDDAAVTAVTLQQGRLVVNPVGQIVFIHSPTRHQAQIDAGIMGVEYIDESSQFSVDCLQGACQLLSAQGDEVNLVEGEYGFVDGDGRITAPAPARYDLYVDLVNQLKVAPTALAELLHTETFVPTSSPIPLAPPLHASLHDTWTRPADNMALVYVPGGAFMMGSGSNDPDAYEIEQPQHEVRLDSFWIDKTEITNAQYALCAAAGACEMLSDAEIDSSSNLPIVNVSWGDANNYCDWVEGQLPTEAQWEYAARGRDGRIYPWGNRFDGTKLNYCDANCPLDWRDNQQSDRYETAAPTASYSPAGDSWVGAADMAGNVWEWVSDWYAGHYYQTLVSPIANPSGPESSNWKVLRGGSWRSNQRYMRSANRINGDPETRANDVGFRCVLASSN